MIPVKALLIAMPCGLLVLIVGIGILRSTIICAVCISPSWAAGSLISGYLLTLSSFGWPLLIGGVVKGVYDILLLLKFRKVRPPEEQGLEPQAAEGDAPQGLSAS